MPLAVTVPVEASPNVINSLPDARVREENHLESPGELVFEISRYERIFCANFSVSSASSSRCLVASDSHDLVLWHRRLGHIGFDHLTRVSCKDLIRGLPKLKAVRDLVCAPCRHGKMVSASHPPLTLVMTDGPGQLT